MHVHTLNKIIFFIYLFQVQYKVQRRQLRAIHPDKHYAAAQFKYLLELAVELTNDKAVLLFADDKANIPIGEPGIEVLILTFYSFLK